MIKEFKSDKTGFIANISINDTLLEIDIPGNSITDDFVNWDYVQMILNVVNESLTEIDEKSQKLLRFYIENSGLYSNEESHLIKGFNLEGITIEGPFSKNPYLTKFNTQFTLHYDCDADTWVDTYGRFEVYILHTSLEGIRRIQM
ncbi:hypothetical protein [Fluviicola taffensis]|uniref:DUF2262 domain-containing protein n=1 Tax=Fluviicola taffensis (strain DSM 16823 / NCIMB 13979 / RW262) TaxID=755732 RepID=F2IHX9_FLUTR|nr:hypothetical protein [Fluviicola taffensis]AEA45938.1 hypothetical protein Fluta_3975 [Fluviicola taffensis DSM 16823]